jgi:group I intron endonuclease
MMDDTSIMPWGMHKGEKLANRPGIYKITCLPTGKIYIGSSKNMGDRKSQHFNHLKTNRHSCKHLQNAFNKYRIDCFRFEAVEFTSIETLEEREQYWIDTLKPQFNNRKIAKNNTGFKFSDASREALKEVRKKQHKPTAFVKGQAPWNKGLKLGPLPEETRKKISVNACRVKSVEHKQKIAAALRGKKKSEEHKRKLSLGRGDTNEKKSAHRKAYFLNPENRKNMSERIKAYYKDPVHRQEISEARKAYWQRIKEQSVKNATQGRPWKQ